MSTAEEIQRMKLVREAALAVLPELYRRALSASGVSPAQVTPDLLLGSDLLLRYGQDLDTAIDEAWRVGVLFADAMPEPGL